MKFELIQQLTFIIGTIAVASGFFKWLLEYSKKIQGERIKTFLKINDDFISNREFANIIELLDIDSVELTRIGVHEKFRFLRFYETIAIYLKTGLIQKDIAFYMFGYYAIQCRNSINFWNNINIDSPYWHLFNEFSETMAAMEETIQAENEIKLKLKF